ncbi:Fc.00g033700.m01.CDS01 [Cosmosporella sp. VM-42]
MPFIDSAQVSDAAAEPKKLILCFDGTGNTFSGTNADTNVVKLLSKLDRNHPNQYHYYQTGIGTYDINETSVNKSFLGSVSNSVSQTLDQGFGTTFDAHVMAGYRFLMRYYESGAKIYMFGFSRGAFTAKFLARMVNTVGLLCKGNEEMVPFAFMLYQRYLAGEIKDREDSQAQAENGNSDAHGEERVPLLNGNNEENQPSHSHMTEVALNEVAAFSSTFCRKEKHPDEDEEHDIKVYFLGIWDCVNSVAVIERNSPIPVPVKGTAQFVRHAVAVDERRVKFKPALLAQDIHEDATKVKKHSHGDEDIKEVWFPGCHGDVGGGWPASENNPLDNKKQMGFWQRIRNFWTTRKPAEASQNVDRDPFQMSDIPLSWMIRELEIVGDMDAPAAVKWCKSAELFKDQYRVKKKQALEGFMHDSLAFGYGTAFFKVLLWKFMGKHVQPSS